MSNRSNVGETMLTRLLHQIDGGRFNTGVLDKLSCPVFVVIPDTSIRYVSPALESLTGFTSTELIGRKAPYPWWVGPHDGKEHKEALRKGFVKSQMQFRKKIGEQFWVETTCIPVEYGGKPCSLITWTDITATKRSSENMEFYISEITRSQEEERKRIAHELYDNLVQSLSALNLDIDDLAGSATPLSEEMASRLDKLRKKVTAIADEARRYSYELHPGSLTTWACKKLWSCWSAI